MKVSKTAILKPRAFENWQLNLGVKNRVKIQSWQSAKHVMRAATLFCPTATLIKTMTGLESRIIKAFDSGYLKLAFDLPIMLIDDVPLLLDGVEKHLKKIGFQNITKFSNPQEAIRAFQAMPVKPRIVITDQSMPEFGISGHEVIERLAKLQPTNKPRFVIFSGNPNLTATDNPARKVIDQEKVLYIQKGCGGELLELSITRAAIRVVKGVPPVADSIALDKISREEVQESPLYQFMGRIVHKLNNDIGVFMILSYDDPMPEDLLDVQTIIKRINHTAVTLTNFAASDLTSPDLKFEQTGLPDQLLQDTTAREIWQNLPPHQRGKLAAIVDQYLQNGLQLFVKKATALKEPLEATEDLTQAFSVANEQFRAAYKDMEQLNHATMLHAKANATRAGIFYNYYKLLETL